MSNALSVLDEISTARLLLDYGPLSSRTLRAARVLRAPSSQERVLDGAIGYVANLIVAGAASGTVRFCEVTSEEDWHAVREHRLRSYPVSPAVPAALEEALRAHRRASDAPAIVVANAGEVNTGDFDDLPAIAAACREHGAWLHVDAAFGLFARCAPGLAALAAGMEAADSIATDLQKLLNVPYDSGLVLLAARHRELYAAVFSAVAPYLGGGAPASAATIHPMNRRVENSSRFRALPAWMTLTAYGRAGYRGFVERLAEHARSLAGRIEASPDYRLAAQPIFDIVLLQGTEADGTPIARADRNQRLLDHINGTGQISLTAGVSRGQPAIRVAFAKWSTGAADVQIAAEALALGMARFRSETAGASPA